jgi:DnaJ-class molecular chaperone
MSDTDEALVAEIRAVEDAAQKEIRRLEGKITSVSAQCTKDVNRIILAAGKAICPDCLGVGAVERLDGSYMRRFGLRDWEGCEKCGGKGETRGRGFVERHEGLPC